LRIGVALKKLEAGQWKTDRGDKICPTPLCSDTGIPKRERRIGRKERGNKGLTWERLQETGDFHQKLPGGKKAIQRQNDEAKEKGGGGKKEIVSEAQHKNW